MNFLVAADTDIGLVKKTNQDSMTLKVIQTEQGPMAFAVLCDGMGGLDKGEVASASVIRAFDRWARDDLEKLSHGRIEDYQIREQWTKIVTDQNSMIKQFGARQGVKLGTTVVVLLVTQSRWYVMNVGDSRVYELSSNIRQVTNDQTFVAREVALGNLTEEQARTDPRRSVLLQCVGASEEVYPDMFFGDVYPNMVFMLCCDGFRHEIAPEEMFAYLQPAAFDSEQIMQRNLRYLIDLNKQRRERDNITVALIKTI